MKKAIIFFAILICGTTALSAEINVVIKSGDMIGHHLHNLDVYPRVKPPEKEPSDPRAPEVAMWRVGNGILHIAHTRGAGIITDMSYVAPSIGKKQIVFKIKAFNPKTGELTILVPSKSTRGDVQ